MGDGQTAGHAGPSDRRRPALAWQTHENTRHNVRAVIWQAEVGPEHGQGRWEMDRPQAMPGPLTAAGQRWHGKRTRTHVITSELSSGRLKSGLSMGRVDGRWTDRRPCRAL